MTAFDARKQIQEILGTDADGQFGPITGAAFLKLSDYGYISEKARQIQQILGATMDGIIGPLCRAAYAILSVAPADSVWPTVANPVAGSGAPQPQGQVHSVIASSFADPADLAAFKHAKAVGMSDEEAFKVGDNCRGKWGDSTAEGSGPSFALPPEDWEQFGANARGKQAIIRNGTIGVVAKLKDTMPHRANITNGCGIDLNPDCCAALNLRPPVRARVTWQWV